MHLSLTSPGLDPWDTPGIPRGLVGVSQFWVKNFARGKGHCASFARNAKPPGYAPTRFVVPQLVNGVHCNSRGNLRPWQLFRFKLVLHCRLGSCRKLVKFRIILGRIRLTIFCGIKTLFDLIGDNSCHVRRIAQLSYISRPSHYF